MSKAEAPSPWGMTIVVCIVAFLIWLGPIGEHPSQQLELDEITVNGVNCNQPLKNLNDTQLEVCNEIQNSTRS